MGSYPRLSKLSTLVSHNSWPDSGANNQTRGECCSVVGDANVTRFPMPNPRRDLDLLHNTTHVNDGGERVLRLSVNYSQDSDELSVQNRELVT